MVNNTEFVSVNYVVLDERPDLGPWGEWSLPSSCSRSCGGGVAFQSRKCRPGSACQGPEKRYFSCNTMLCPPGSKDFRSEQCSKFDTQDFEGDLYEWIPYTEGANNCELNCKPRGERFYNKFAKKVVDGTRCNDETLDVCVEGKCMPVGCDLFLGSSLREDKCRDCGGDNSGCITVSEIISFETDSSDVERGYNDLLLIPAGATNIFVRELNPTNNLLAIRNENNTYYLNGHYGYYLINYPDRYHFAGTVFHYERQRKNFWLDSEVIRALGPTNESLYIALLYQEKGEGIEYEYSFSKDEQSGDSENYFWVTHDFSECSSPCGGGSQNRMLGCAKKSDNSTVSLRLCNPVKRPATTQRCNEETCDPEWFVSLWSQFRRVYCLQKISNRMTVIEDDVCIKKYGEKPIATQPCNEECNKGKQCKSFSEDHDTTVKTTESTSNREATTAKSEPTSSQMVHPITTPAGPEPQTTSASNAPSYEFSFFRQNCTDGAEEYIDRETCARCRCHKPCQSTACPEKTKCVVETIVADDQSRHFRPVCRQLEKPGVCPTVEEEAGNCTHTCREDADCGGKDKCCYNGCAYQCSLNPYAVDVTPPPVTTTQAPEPEQPTTSELQIHPNCTDSPFYAQCKVIVKGKFCTLRYYTRFCCRSCTEDGQLPLDGAHLYGGSSRK
ncbi:papilin-like [Cloeon dipterum]|uniref:papilin-like n=1 Tax=Cloeon dipterum TaxID=197152 RepID=UPI00321F9003